VDSTHTALLLWAADSDGRAKWLDALALPGLARGLVTPLLSGIYKTSVPYYKSHWNRQGSITIETAESFFDGID